MQMSREDCFGLFSRTVSTWVCMRDDVKTKLKVIRSLCNPNSFSVGHIQPIGTQKDI